MDVLMFHSIGNEKSKWHLNCLSMTVRHFESFCKYLSGNRYITECLDKWYYLQDHPQDQSRKYVFLTFDDGYLDNWVYVYPILKKYNLKGTIFINPAFVDIGTQLRPSLEDVWFKNMDINKLQSLGYLNWPEIKELYNSGVLDVQSHCMTHNFCFSSNKIIDIYRGQDQYYWLAWLSKPERIPFWITEDQKNYVEFGTPIFEFGRSLELRRYIPSREINDYSINLFKEKPELDVKEHINLVTKKLTEFPGEFESQQEMVTRYEYELIKSKKILECRLSKKVNFLCWPGGGYNNLSTAIAKAAGYLATTIGTKHREEKYDNTKQYKRIKRYGIGSAITVNGKSIIQNNKYFVVRFFKMMQGNKYHLMNFRLKKLYYIVKCLDANTRNTIINSKINDFIFKNQCK